MKSYAERSLVGKLVAAGAMLVAAHCLEWWGLLRIFSSSVGDLEVRVLRSYVWNADEALRIADLHDRQGAWMSLLSDAYLFYAVAAAVVVAAAWRLGRIRTAAVCTAVLLVATFVFDGPLLAGRALIDHASGGHFMEAVDRGGSTYTGTYLSPLTPLSGGVLKSPLTDRRDEDRILPLLSHRLVPALAAADFAALLACLVFRRRRTPAAAEEGETSCEVVRLRDVRGSKPGGR